MTGKNYSCQKKHFLQDFITVYEIHAIIKNLVLIQFNKYTIYKEF